MTKRRKPRIDPDTIVSKTTRAPSDSLDELPGRLFISEYLAEIGRKGGLKGGKARAQKLSQKRRTEIARMAAEKRWNKS